eukprot:jgi/Tetstr1/432879/TSEL_022228.t1
MLFMDLRDGFYAVGVAPEDRNYFTVNCYRSKLFRLAGLPMVASQGVSRAKLSMGQRQALRNHFRGCRMLPYMGNFVFFRSSRAQPYTVRGRLTSPLGRLVSADNLTRANGSRYNGRLEHLATAAPSTSRSVETAYMHVDSSGYGWGAVLNETTEARGFWYDGDRELHTIFKELKAIRYAVLTFLSSCEVDMY